MVWFLGQSILIIVAAFLLGLLLGWLLWGLGRAVALDSVEPAADASPAPEPAPAPAFVPVPVSVAGPDDNLQRIEGIGPRMEAAMHNAGIRTYVQLAGTDVATLRTAIEAAGMNFAPSITTWATQARLLADGDEHGFTELLTRLVAGRDVGRVG